MELKEMIYRRKSVRAYTGEPVDEETLRKIEAFITGIKPLYPEINVCSEIVGREKVKCFLPWTTPQLIAIYSEDKEGALENVGFIFQQLDLYLQSIGLGVCWLGMGRMNPSELKREDGLNYVIMLAFGYPKGDALRESLEEFKRNPISAISDQEDARLEPARFAPSSVNSQPWYFTHEGDVLHVHCVQKGFFKAKALGDMNQIDIGIALAHMYVANPDTFRFFKAENTKRIKGYRYIGSFTV